MKPGIIDGNKATRRVPHEQPCPGAIQEVGSTIAIDVGDCEMIPLLLAADTGRPQAHLLGDIFEQRGDARLEFPGGEIKRPLAVSLADLQQQVIASRFQLQNQFCLIGSSRPRNILRQEFLAIQPDAQTVIAAERDGEETHSRCSRSAGGDRRPPGPDFQV